MFLVSDYVFFQESSATCCLSRLEYIPSHALIPFIVRESTAPGAKKKNANLRLKKVPGSHRPFVAMSCEVQLGTLQGSVITLDIPITALLLAKHPCQDPIERKILKVELLRDSSIIDDADTLEAAGFFCAESLVTIACTRNEVEAAMKDDIDDTYTQRCFAVKIPCNLTEISSCAFQNCNQLVLVTIRGSVTRIGYCAFASCESLTNISMGESVTHIGPGAFARCESLTRISMGESVTHIGDQAFASCESLTNISMGEFVTHIGDRAFAWCKSLTNISMGESVTHIGDEAFADCRSLMSFSIGESVTHIGDRAFAWCKSLTNICVGEPVTHIEDEAFADCRSLMSISIGESVTHIGAGNFAHCTSLTNIVKDVQCARSPAPRCVTNSPMVMCDAHSPQRLCTLHIFDEHQHGWKVCLGAESESSSKIIAVPATEGRKLPRSEGSVQICHDGKGWYNLGRKKIVFFPLFLVALVEAVGMAK